MVTESQAKIDEYIEGRRLSQEVIIKEIKEEKDKEIERLIEVNKACHALIKARGNEIEQLKRELSEAYLTMSSNKGNEQ